MGKVGIPEWPLFTAHYFELTFIRAVLEKRGSPVGGEVLEGSGGTAQ